MCVFKGKNGTFSLGNLIVYPHPSNPTHLKLKHLTNPARHLTAEPTWSREYRLDTDKAKHQCRYCLLLGEVTNT